MAHRVYVPSGKSDSGALLVLFGAMFATAILGGVVEGFIANWFSLLVLFPLLLGLIIGSVGVVLVTSRRVRNPLMAGLIGLTAGLVGQACVHFMAYEHARTTVAEVIAKNPDAAEFVREKGMSAAVDMAFAGDTGSAPIVGYIKLAAETGITITHGGSSSSGPTLTGTWAYLLWILEFLLAAGLAAWMPASQARDPFCEPCETWYRKEEVVATGAGDGDRVKATVESLKNGQFARATSELGKSDGVTVSTLVLRGCQKCSDHEPVLELRRTSGAGRKRETKKMFSVLLTQREAAELRPVNPAVLAG